VATTATTTTEVPAYTHIVSRPDRTVRQGFSLSGWSFTKRHAANRVGSTPYGRQYKTVCGETLTIDPEYYPEAAVKRGGVGGVGGAGETNDVPGDPAGTGWVTCDACRKKLGLRPLK
jgi:hypothetical protein